MTPEALEDALATLLTQAEQSHLAHEQQYGATDWPPYYSEFLYRALGTEFTLEQLSSALRDAAAAHGEFEAAHGGERDDEWARWYAQHMAGALSRDWYRFIAETEAWDV